MRNMHCIGIGWLINCFKLVNSHSIKMNVFFQLLHVTVRFLTGPIAEIGIFILQLTLLLKVKAKTLS